MRVLAVLAVLALGAVVIAVFVRANRRDEGTSSFWPQSPAGQVVAAALVIFVVGAVISIAV